MSVPVFFMIAAATLWCVMIGIWYYLMPFQSLIDPSEPTGVRVLAAVIGLILFSVLSAVISLAWSLL